MISAADTGLQFPITIIIYQDLTPNISQNYIPHSFVFCNIFSVSFVFCNIFSVKLI